MSIKRSIATKITNAINVAFKKIGTSNGTSLPPAPKDKNTTPIAWEYHVASQLKRVADARKKEAFEECIKADLFPDPIKLPSPTGTKASVYADNAVIITLTVKQPATRIDVDKLCVALAASGVKENIITAAREQASTTNRPAHEYSTSLLTSDD